MAGEKGKLEKPSGPGWYPDPFSADGRGERYFDGTKWGSSMTPLAGHKPKRHKEARANASGRPPTQGRRYLGPAIVFLLVVAAVWVVPKLTSDGTSRDTAASKSSDPLAVQHPPPRHEEALQPLGVPARVPAGAGQFESLIHQDGDPATPVAWDPCRPIHYVVNPLGAPKDGTTLIRRALTRLQKATGLHFIDDGTSRERPDKQRLAYQPKNYDKRGWAPVLIAWSDENAFPDLEGYIAGLGAPDAIYAPSGPLVYVSGQVVFDRRQMSTVAMPDRHVAESIVLHEFGHLVGLGHTSDRNEIMFSEAQFNVRDYGPGDLRGLAALGTRDCFPDV